MTEKIRIVIIEDTGENCAFIASMLRESPFVEICGITEDVSNGVKLILAQLPDAIFLYSHESYYHNFGIIETLKQSSCHAPIVFTVKDENTLPEIVKNNSFSCLQKPINPGELGKCLSKLRTSLKAKEPSDALLLKKSNSCAVKIRFNTRTGFVLIDPDEIVFCKASQNYTELYLSETEKIVATVQIGRIACLLENTSLKRIGKSFMVNTNYVTAIDRKQQRCILKRDGKLIPLQLSLNYLKALDGLFQ